MLAKNYTSKTMSAVSTLAISAVLLGSIFVTPSLAMEERDLEDESHFARVPAEVTSHIFGSLPLKPWPCKPRLSHLEGIGQRRTGGFWGSCRLQKNLRGSKNTPFGTRS
ncbi:MAG: hypothetical protein BGO67_05855 [Alphaproteobacteria bacterium 41-28]|nr:MAG: hypothetical protein BGO67_05855 [Alphaproteobacteria bacterium 41-28]